MISCEREREAGSLACCHRVATLYNAPTCVAQSDDREGRERLMHTGKLV